VTDPAVLPEELEAVAWSSITDTGGDAGEEIQAVRHREFPVWGVQFHPESLFSEGGMSLLRNFLEI
jgi:anthranilate synthase component 2